MRGLDIAVAGCGPAGLSAALLLARDGHNVRIFERFDAPRPIGSGLMIQPTGLAVLAALGLDRPLRDAGARIDRLFGLAMPSGRTVLNVRYEWIAGGHCGVGVHRATLFETLYRAVRDAAVAIETSRTIAGSVADAGGRVLLFADGSRSARFDLVIDCLGAGSPLAPACGSALPYGALWATVDWPGGDAFDPAALEQRYLRASRMVGVMPIGRGIGANRDQATFFWSLRADRLEPWRAAGLEAWKTEVRALWPATAPLLDQVVDQDQLAFARYAHRTVPRPQWNALIHIGDAWHSTSPQLGQGANLAMLDAYALALALRETPRLTDALRKAAALRAFHVRLFQLLSALFTPAYQSDGRFLPFVRDRVIAPFIHIWPVTEIQAAMVTGLIGNPLGRLGLARASTDPRPVPARTG